MRKNYFSTFSSYKNSDGQGRHEKGTRQDDDTFVVVGSFTYIDSNNEKVETKYQSDKDGYRIIE